MNKNKFDGILKLSSPDRYGYFIRKVADFEEVWLIRDDSEFVKLANNAEQPTIPVFPEKEFANYLLVGDWQNCLVKKVNLDNFLLLLNQWQEQRISVAGFPNADLKAVVVEAKEMKNHLLHELQQYE